jgi:hypothetical protein
LGSQDLAQGLSLMLISSSRMSGSPGLHVKNAPSPRLVFTYLIAGLVSFLFLGGWTALAHGEFAGFYANTRFLAWVHVAVLGWINMIIFGVLFQFIPVVLNVRLGSEKLAWWQLAFYLPGAAGMAACFWIGRLDWPLHSFASVLWLGFFLFIWNMLITYRQVTDWTTTAKCIYAGVLYLLVTILLGLFLSIHLAYPMVEMSHLTLLKLHAHFGFAGWFIMIILGVSLKLLPMFLLAHDYSTRAGMWAFYLVNAGLLSWAGAVVFELPPVWQKPGALVLAGGVAFYLVQVVEIYRHRNLVRSDPFRKQTVRRIEFPLRFAAVAFGVLAVVVLLGLLSAVFGRFIDPAVHNRLILVYGALLFLGFLSLLTQSFLYKIVPFLIWLRKFSGIAGRQRLPKIDDLVPRRSGIAQLAAYCTGVLLVIVALGWELRVAGAAGAATLFVSSVWLVGNLVAVWKRAVPLGPLVPSAACETRKSTESNDVRPVAR